MSSTEPEPDTTSDASASTNPFERFRNAAPMSEEAKADWDLQAQPGTPG